VGEGDVQGHQSLSAAVGPLVRCSEASIDHLSPRTKFEHCPATGRDALRLCRKTQRERQVYSGVSGASASERHEIEVIGEDVQM
jgi:hypothetical protein